MRAWQCRQLACYRRILVVLADTRAQSKKGGVTSRGLRQVVVPQRIAGLFYYRHLYNSAREVQTSWRFCCSWTKLQTGAQGVVGPRCSHMVKETTSLCC
ncbi:hypothetical protein EVAR_5448_1 [Eumeta japonica]|uniref:Uncharacterized protein n=1 Tax=Eumeta variegata TaxID=151549 RepID=A0A4C1TBS9_EUMVA|nr:hypothetical protein EVAR_5448_1 [Eumeta japonica]